MREFLKLFISSFAFLLCIVPTYALVISEAQFDPAGSDTDREWVEIFNDYSYSVDLTSYKFYENNTNHGIDVLSGDKNIQSGEYVVLVQDMNKFKADFPSYTGKIFKSSFSLSNSGESLSVKDKDGNTVSTLNYSPTSTGAGNGTTVNFDGVVQSKGTATPGSGNLQVNLNSQAPVIQTSTTTTQTATTTSTTTETTSGSQNSDLFSAPIYYYRSYFPESEKIYVYAGESRISLVGSDVFFTGKVVRGDSGLTTGANLFWNFGDGETAEGTQVKHVYKYPGEYVVDLEGYWNGAKSEDRIYVKVMEGNFKVSMEGGDTKKVKIENVNSVQIDIGGMLLRTWGGVSDVVYTIKNKTIILPNKSIYLSQDLVKFATDTKNIELKLANGNLLSSFEIPALVNTPAVLTPVATVTSVVVPKVAKSNKAAPLAKKPATSTVVQIKETEKFVIKEEESIWDNLLSYLGI
jgi:hypothetical protein